MIYLGNGAQDSGSPTCAPVPVTCQSDYGRRRASKLHRQRLRVGEGDRSWRISPSATLPQSPESPRGLAQPQMPRGSRAINRQSAGNTAHQHSGWSPQVIPLAPPSPRRLSTQPQNTLMSNRLTPPGQDHLVASPRSMAWGKRRTSVQSPNTYHDSFDWSEIHRTCKCFLRGYGTQVGAGRSSPRRCPARRRPATAHR
jgi:hypothetical protein